MMLTLPNCTVLLDAELILMLIRYLQLTIKNQKVGCCQHKLLFMVRQSCRIISFTTYNGQLADQYYRNEIMMNFARTQVLFTWSTDQLLFRNAIWNPKMPIHKVKISYHLATNRTL